MPLSWESVALYTPGYERKVESRTAQEPTEADWADYREACDLLERLEASPYYQAGGPDYGAEISEPRTTYTYVYAETVEEWKERCKEVWS